VADFVDCQRDQLVGSLWTVGSFACGDGGEDGVGEDGQGGVAVPGVPFADLVLVEAGLAFGGLEAFFDASADAGDTDQVGDGRGGG
jgi:hypothetical protein